MNTYMKGNVTGIGIAIALATVLGVGLVWYSGMLEPQEASKDAMMQKEDADQDGAMMHKEEDSMMMKKEENGMMMQKDGNDTEMNSMMHKEDTAMMEGGASMEKAEMVSFAGTRIAGSASPLLEFNSADYDAAIASDKLVMLYFYANWCPNCRAEFKHTQSAFDQLETDGVVGFRVHYNDDDVTPEMQALAREHGVAYQHTKVFIQNGERTLKTPETWNTERYLNELAGALNQ